ncbi:hypothetical protein FQN57_004649 [Myotisia sp. PD_48]|nr:hypothetical protein FQN57_004649 [Myotisia sp. PD_48]
MKFRAATALLGLIVPSAVCQSRTVWSGWGGNILNNRLASAGSTLRSDNVDSIQEHCRLTYTNGLSATPVISDDTVYFPTWSGMFVALDYTNCKVQWELNVTSLVLEHGPITGPMVVARPVSRTSPQIDGNILYFGTLARALIVAVDRRNGKVLDQIQLNPNPTALVTMSPTFYAGKLFVGTSSMENLASAIIPGYPCCSFVGNMTALEFDERKSKFSVAWNRNTLPPNTKWSGASVWGSQPAIDARRGHVIVATGNLYTAPKEWEKCANETSADCLPSNILQETVLALDLKTGRTKWENRIAPMDIFNGACGGQQKPDFCPEKQGPDADFGMAPALVRGRTSRDDALILGQKNGTLYSLSAATGKINWATATSPSGMAGGLSWGLAADDKRAYFTGINSARKSWKLTKSNQTITNSAYGGVNLKNGEILWETPAPLESTAFGPPTVVGDVVVVARTQEKAAPKGGLVFLSQTTGKVLGDIPLDAVFHGGIAIYGKYLMFGTGYGGGTGSIYILKTGGAK